MFLENIIAAHNVIISKIVILVNLQIFHNQKNTSITKNKFMFKAYLDCVCDVHLFFFFFKINANSQIIRKITNIL